MNPHKVAQTAFEESLEVVDIVTLFWTDALHEDAEEYFTQDLENY